VGKWMDGWMDGQTERQIDYAFHGLKSLGCGMSKGLIKTTNEKLRTIHSIIHLQIKLYIQ
jgi:hypothetical protein